MEYKVFVKSKFTSPSVDHVVDVGRDHLKKRNAPTGIVEIEIVEKDKMQQINRKFRGKDYPTDVLSFPSAEFPHKEKLYGTIFLSYDIIKLNAQKSDKSFEEEFDFILRHGIDHLLGIHHK